MTTPPAKEIWLSRYQQRADPGAAKHFIRSSKTARFEGDVRRHILLEVQEEAIRIKDSRMAQSVKESRILSKSDLYSKDKAREAISKYYGVSMRSLGAWEFRLNKGEIDTKERSGRPRAITSPVKKIIIDTANAHHGRSVRSTTAKVKSKVPKAKRGQAEYETTYKGKKRRSPSKSSVHAVMAEGESLSVKRRPFLKKENKQLRYEYAVQQLQLSDEERNDNVVAIDESWISLDKAGKGMLIQHPKATPVTKRQRVRTVRNKNHPDKILVIGVIARPKILNKDTAGQEPARFCEINHGKVAIVRCVAEEKYKKRVYETVNGEKKLKHAVGDSKWVSVTIDGARYKDFLVRPGGIFDRIREYFGPDVPIRMQEDGAPGHGYNNKRNRSPTQVHDEMVAIAELRGINVFKQPHNSPELNPLDLGIWHSLQSRVKHTEIEGSSRENDAFVESQIWEAAKLAFWSIPSRTIWNCWMAKDEILKLLVANKGAEITSEPHNGVRTQWGTHEPNV